MSSLNIVDIVFFTTSLFMILIATYRGLIKEFFSFLNWILAFVFSYIFAPFLVELLSDFSESKLLLNIIVRVVVFMLSFIIFLIFTDGYCQDITNSINVFLNRLCGALFGFFKAVLIFGLIFSIYNSFFDYALGNRLVNKASNRLPKWYIDSYSSTLISFAGDSVDPVVKGFVGFLKLDFIKSKDKVDELFDYKAKFKEQSSSIENNEEQKTPPKRIINQENSGYEKKDLEKMQRLIEIINK